MVKSASCDRRVYSTDDLAHNLWLNLLGDFRTSYGDSFYSDVEAVFLDSLHNYRMYTTPIDYAVEPGLFKRQRQLENLLKKYRFANDVYSDEQLREITLKRYFSEQLRILNPKRRSYLGYIVLKEARSIVRSILGSYSEDDVIRNCRFGKKSSIGCPLSLAYIDVKLSKAEAFTGSSQCSKWFFDKVLLDDKILSEIVSKIDYETIPGALKHDSLNLVMVPKTWKVQRLITPLTLLSLFKSNGLGVVVTKRLKESGLDISRLQDRHRYLVQKLSVTKSHATADLSSASDSITKELLLALLPRDWYRNIKDVLTHQVVWKNSDEYVSAYTGSVLPMGNGLTFPLETLVFYSLIKAIGNLTGIRGIFSVYGDDLIYPVGLHKYVMHFFDEFGLVINRDKTFVKLPFRESCGSDFFRGCDVRSFYLQGSHQSLNANSYRAYLHKTINGLRRRWADEEIPGTLCFLFNELQCVSKSLLRVPQDYPDISGIKVDSPSDYPISKLRYRWSPIILKRDTFKYEGKVRETDNFVYVFSAIEAVSERRSVECIMPYYWLALQGLNDDLDSIESWHQRPPSPHQTRTSSLLWKTLKRVRFYTRKDGRVVKKKLVKVSPTVAARISERFQTRRGSTYVWT